MRLKLVDERGCQIFYNTKIKKFSNGQEFIKKSSYLVSVGLSNPGYTRKKSSSLKSSYKSLYISKLKMIDYATENMPWDFFVTLTFDKNEVDRFDYSSVRKLFTKWIDNVKHQNKNLKYIFVPELHKNGAVHIHGMIGNCPNLKIIPAVNPHTCKHIYKNGSQIFNIKNFTYGFTTISKIKNQEACSVYVSKYMSKDLIDFSFKNKYFRSHNLKKPIIEYDILSDDEILDFMSINNITFYKEINHTSNTIKLIKKD